MSPSLVRNLEKEVITLRREVIDLRIRLSTRADEKLLKRKKLESLTKQLEDATNTIKIMHHIVDNKTQLLKETVVAIEQHEEYQQSQEQDSRSKIAQMESHIRELEVRTGSCHILITTLSSFLYLTFYLFRRKVSIGGTKNALLWM